MTEAAALDDPYGERTRMMTWRVAFLALTILASGALAPVAVDVFGGGIPGHRAMGLLVAMIMVGGSVAVVVLTPFRVLVSCFVAQAAGVGAMLAGVRYFADHVMHDRGATTLLFVGVVGPAILVMPVWNAVGARLGKLRGYVAASLVLTVGTFALALAPWLPPVGVYGMVAVIGCGYAGQQVFSLAMLPDCIAHETARTGRRQAGVFTGVWTAAETLGLAVGPYLFGQTLEIFGYVPSTTGTAAPQTATAELGVLLGFTVVPGVVVALALLFLRGYEDRPAT
jgi:Na+/melibiose symporter-like transporter